MSDALLHALLRQGVLIAVVAIALLTLRRPLARYFSPGLAYAAWTVLPALLLVDLLPASRAVPTFAPGQIRMIDGPPAEPVTATTGSPLASSTLWLSLWAVGALVIVARMVWLQRRFGATLTHAPHARHWIGEQGPALVGLWPARLVLPPDFEQRFDARQRPLVLAHEDVHRRRFDNHWNALAAALCALHWFNPLAWLALRAMRADQEVSCDQAVMRRFPGREADYGRALLRAQQSPSPLQPWSAWRSSHPLIDRVAMLRHPPRSLFRRMLGAALLATLALGAASAVHATKPRPADIPPGEARISLDIAVEVTTGTKAASDKRKSSMRLIVREGEQAMVLMGGTPDKPAPDQVKLVLTARRQPPGSLLGDLFVTVVASQGGRPLYENEAVMANAKPSHLNVAPADGSMPIIDLRITPTLQD